MKKQILLLLVIISTQFSWAQIQFNDVVYPLDGSDPIVNCLILDIVDGNMVVYSYENNTREIKAISVKENGHFIDLSEYAEQAGFTNQESVDDANFYKGYNYNYYVLKYDRSRRLTSRGRIFSFTGITLGVLGYFVMSNLNDWDSELRVFGVGTFLAGGILTSIGIPSMVIGQVKSKKYKEGIKYFEKRELSLNYGITPNGLGVVLNF